MVEIRVARPNEASAISELAINSKAYWGYSFEFMQECKAELSHSSEQLKSSNCLYTVALIDQSIIGFYKLENIYQETVLLEALFIKPSMIGLGYGRKLYQHAKGTAADIGANFIAVQSDPNAENFYKSVGMTVTGKALSGSIEGRYLPTLISSTRSDL